jgi:hypothetical protein
LPQTKKDITRKESHRHISLKNIYATLLNNVLTNQIQQHIKMIIQPGTGGSCL